MESRAPPQALPMGLRRVSKVCYPHHPGPALYARVFFIAWSCVKRAPEPHRAASSRPCPNGRIGLWWLYSALGHELEGGIGWQTESPATPAERQTHC